MSASIPAMTDKQIAILKALMRRNPDGSFLDVYQLMDEVPGASREAMICSLNRLIKHNLVKPGEKVKRKNRSRQTYEPTGAAYAVMRAYV